MLDSAPDTAVQTQGAPFNLFAPVHVGPYTLANRVVMAPMTRNRAGAGNAPGDMNVEYYRQRAGAGLIITEGTQVSPQGVGYPGTPGIHSAPQVAGWRRVTDAVHVAGGHIFLQLWHVGRISHPSLQPDGTLPVAPSAIRPEGDAMTLEGFQPFVVPRPLKTDEIPGIVEQHRLGALNALEAGFDGVEIHAANGYLLDQFLRDGSNRRMDAYGGPLENRVRLLLEVTEAVAGIWGAARVGVRLSPINSFNSMEDSNPNETFTYVAGRLDAYDLAYLHVVEGDFADTSNTFDWESMHRAFTGTYMVNGGYDQGRASAALASGAADLVSFGKPFLANPDLVERFVKATPLNEPDQSTFYGGDEEGYTDYPNLPG